MKLFALRQPSALGSEHAIPPGPWTERVIVSIDGQSQRVLAAAPPLNVLAGAVPPLPRGDLPAHLVLHSGWLPEDSPANQEIYPEDPRIWMGEGRRRLDEVLAWLAPEVSPRGSRIALRTHARQVLGDPHACAAFLNDHPEIDLALDPVSMLTADMLVCADDHLGRIADQLFTHPRVAMVLLHNLRRADGARDSRDGGEIAPCSIHEGLIDPGLLVSLGERAGDHGKAIVLREGGLARQLGLLRPAGIHTMR